jgi:hypothetical protein
MGKSSRTGRRNGTVTVIETRVHRNSARNARLAFVLAALFVGGIAAVAASQWTEPVLSLLIGIAVGVVAGAICWAAVRVWPVVRVIWWWFGELLACAVITVVWSLLATHTSLAVRATIVAVLIAALVIPRVRRPIVALGWCFVVRHRLRTCFAQFIVANQSGSLPLILAARPTPVGERVWIYLRPGLSVNELQSRVDKIAVACHASTVIIDRASSRTAAFVRVDIKRRDVLGSIVGTPLSTNMYPISPESLEDTQPAHLAALDLSDVLADTKSEKVTTPSTRSTPSTPLAEPLTATIVPIRPPMPPTSSKKVAATVSAGEDLSDWID